MTKRDLKPNDIQSSNGNNGERDSDGTGDRASERSKSKYHNAKGQSHTEDGHKLTRAECYLWEEPHKLADWPYRADCAIAPDESQPKHGGFIGSGS